MRPSYRFSRHARDRSTGRAIPRGIAQMIVEFGASRDAGDDARKYALSGESMSQLRREYGPEIAKTLEPYRRLGAYVVAREATIITVAFADKPLFN